MMIDNLSFDDLLVNSLLFDSIDLFNVGFDIDSFLSNSSNQIFDDIEDKYSRLLGIFATYLGCSILNLDMLVISIIDISAIRHCE